MLYKFEILLFSWFGYWLASLPLTALSLWLAFRKVFPGCRRRIRGRTKRVIIAHGGCRPFPNIWLIYEEKLLVVYWLWFALDLSDWGQEEISPLRRPFDAAHFINDNGLRYRTFQMCTAFIAQHTCREQNFCNWCEHARQLRKDLDRLPKGTVG